MTDLSHRGARRPRPAVQLQPDLREAAHEALGRSPRSSCSQQPDTEPILEQTRRWLQHYNAQPGVQALVLCAKKASEVDRILPACRALRRDRGGADKPPRMMILGIPNVGKSTPRERAPQAATSRTSAMSPPSPRFRCSTPSVRGSASLVDTPGSCRGPGMEQDTALKLAATHSIVKSAAYDDEDAALSLGSHAAATLSCAPRGAVRLVSPSLRRARVAGVHRDEPPPGQGGSARPRGCAATALLNDFRSGALGRISPRDRRGGVAQGVVRGRRLYEVRDASTRKRSSMPPAIGSTGARRLTRRPRRPWRRGIVRRSWVARSSKRLASRGFSPRAERPQRRLRNAVVQQSFFALIERVFEVEEERAAEVDELTELGLSDLLRNSPTHEATHPQHRAPRAPAAARRCSAGAAMPDRDLLIALRLPGPGARGR